MRQRIKSLKKKKYILYLSYDGMTDPLGQSQVLPYLVGLSQKGYQFHLISFEKQDKFQAHKEVIKKVCDEAGIKWYPLMYTKRPPVLSTLFDIRKMNAEAVEIHRAHDIQMVHCRSYISALIGLKLKRKFGISFLFDMRGFWADERVDGSIWKLKNPIFRSIYNFFKRKEKEFLFQADQVISLTYEGKKEILQRIVPTLPEEKITVIPCCVNMDLFDPEKIAVEQQNSLRSALKINENDRILGYVGSIGTWYMLPEMLDFFKTYLKNNPSAKFLFVTPDPAENILEEAKRRAIDHQKLIVTRCLHHEVPLYVSLFDLGLFFIRPSYSKKASSPTKQGELMAMGIPVVCNSGVGDSDLVVEKFNSGIVLQEFNASSYSQDIPDHWDQKSIRRGGEEFYGLTKGVELYASVYSKLIS